jgi:hypothetical protein
MFYKYLLLFFIVCIITGITTFAGSVIGHLFGQQALFAGAIFGGISGVFLSCLIAIKIKKLQPANFKSTFTGGVLGYTIAAIIAVNSLHSPLITMGSMAFAGAGAVVGYSIRKKN